MSVTLPPAPIRRATRKEGALAGLICGAIFAAAGLLLDNLLILLAIPVGVLLGALLARRVRVGHRLPWGTIVLGGLLAPGVGAFVLSFGIAAIGNPATIIEAPDTIAAVAGLGTLIFGFLFVPVTIPATLAWAYLTRRIASRTLVLVPQPA